eukprot:scaffold648234_cov47-Prasinocladus_malaysianus.AAC.1
MLWAALHRTAQKDARVVLRGQLDRGLPEADTGGHPLQRLAEHAGLRSIVRLQPGGLHPQLDR